ncbi:MAG: cytochrome c [Bacteroidetes bacterium]|nr:cytochrome c [Bacteroidota bacterium]
MKKRTLVISSILLMVFIGMQISSCSSQRAMIANKTGAQLWAENCQRCHTTPSPNTFNDQQWEAVGMHMQIRANLTPEEIAKVVEFLQSANQD